MAKRSRGTSRPGRRRAAARQAARPYAGAPAPTVRPSTLSREEEERAAELEAQIVAEERAGEAARDRLRDRGRQAPEPAGRGRQREGSLLAARAADEYVYVARDVRRIVQIGGSMVGAMLVLWVIIEVIRPF